MSEQLKGVSLQASLTVKDLSLARCVAWTGGEGLMV
jgi:hypothetical protein